MGQTLMARRATIRDDARIDIATDPVAVARPMATVPPVTPHVTLTFAAHVRVVEAIPQYVCGATVLIAVRPAIGRVVALVVQPSTYPERVQPAGP